MAKRCVDVLMQKLDAALFDFLLGTNKHTIWTVDGVNRCGAKGCKVHNNTALFRDVLPGTANYKAYHYCARCGSGAADHTVDQCPAPTSDVPYAVEHVYGYEIKTCAKTGFVSLRKVSDLKR
jgi:hypothetical protein